MEQIWDYFILLGKVVLVMFIFFVFWMFVASPECETGAREHFCHERWVKARDVKPECFIERAK